MLQPVGGAARGEDPQRTGREGGWGRRRCAQRTERLLLLPNGKFHAFHCTCGGGPENRAADDDGAAHPQGWTAPQGRGVSGWR
ncbi:hypothetical protein AVL61_02300 [Kocuria rosea subsp. polaris]|uniref:Uncharacterized protein n=1 Tax=Kocuria rosea subsp. polaris TaxID=136273 RepID=A0A0W8IPC4_KOCRO|nr:hypothetical protein AVL61_02300 [Kocuria polaris]